MNQAGDALESANRDAWNRLCAAEPVLVDVVPAIDARPGMAKHTVLTSGPPLPWPDYVGGQREAILGGALFEGLAADRDEAEAKLGSGDIVGGGCHDFGAGVVRASMPCFESACRAYRDRFGTI